MRTRAAVAAVFALTPVLVAAATAGVLVQGDELTRATALVAEEQARTVVRDLPARTDPANARSGTTGRRLGGEETLVQVVSADGSVLDASPALHGAPAMLGAPQNDQVREGHLSDLVEGEDDTYLAVAVPVVDAAARRDGSSPARDGYVVAARSLEPVNQATASTTRLLAVGVPILVALMAALSWFLAGRALRPVEALSSRAAQITAAGADARLPEIDTGDEIEHLTDTLNKMLERLEASARSQRQFVADASHELRSPVASIRTVMEVASTTAATDWDEVSNDVLSETARLERLVSGLLSLARRDTGAGAPATRFEPVNLAELVREELRRPRRLEITATLPDDALVLGDPQALASIITNLLDNADRHGHHHIDLHLTHSATWVDMTVADDGDGIPAHEAERVFERFVRLDEARTRDTGGTGLGLAIARAIAHDHGGTLTLDQPRQVGARLHLRLPARR